MNSGPSILPGREQPGNCAWLVAYVPILFFAFPQRLAGFVIDGGLWLGPLSVACFVLGTAGLGPKRAAIRGFVAGWFAHAAILHWIYIAVVRYGDAPPWVGVLAVLAIAVYPALASAGVAAMIAKLCTLDRATPIAMAVVFTLGDHLQSFVATGFPWSLLGYTQLANPGLLPWARFGAVYLVGFGAALGGAVLAGAFRSLTGRGELQRGLGVAVVLGVGLHALGLFAIGADDLETGAIVRVAALQGNVEQDRKWSLERYEKTLADYGVLTRAAAREGAELIVWPETAVPGPLEIEPSVSRYLGGLARETGATLIVGAVGVDRLPGSFRISKWYDSAFVIEPDGGLAGRYDKSHLVPFGEYVPFREWLGRIVAAVARGVAALDVSAGAKPRALRVYVPDRRSGAGGPIRLGVPICYELLFPDLVRRFVDEGSELLVAITNDAWYGRTGAPYQFLAITAMRSAETGVATVRAANTGVSAIIDARGEVQEQSSLFERSFVIADVRLGGGPEGFEASFYARFGDLFAGVCWVGLVLVAGLGLVGRRRQQATARVARNSND